MKTHSPLHAPRSLAAALAFAGLSFSAAAGTYYPDPFSPVLPANSELAAIQNHVLNLSSSTKSLVLPLPGGYTAPSSILFRQALTLEVLIDPANTANLGLAVARYPAISPSIQAGRVAAALQVQAAAPLTQQLHAAVLGEYPGSARHVSFAALDTVMSYNTMAQYSSANWSSFASLALAATLDAKPPASIDTILTVRESVRGVRNGVSPSQTAQVGVAKDLIEGFIAEAEAQMLARSLPQSALVDDVTLGATMGRYGIPSGVSVGDVMDAVFASAANTRQSNALAGAAVAKGMNAADLALLVTSMPPAATPYRSAAEVADIMAAAQTAKTLRTTSSGGWQAAVLASQAGAPDETGPILAGASIHCTPAQFNPIAQAALDAAFKTGPLTTEAMTDVLEIAVSGNPKNWASAMTWARTNLATQPAVTLGDRTAAVCKGRAPLSIDVVIDSAFQAFPTTQTSPGNEVVQKVSAAMPQWDHLEQLMRRSVALRVAGAKTYPPVAIAQVTGTHEHAIIAAAAAEGAQGSPVYAGVARSQSINAAPPASVPAVTAAADTAIAINANPTGFFPIVQAQLAAWPGNELDVCLGALIATPGAVTPPILGATMRQNQSITTHEYLEAARSIGDVGPAFIEAEKTARFMSQFPWGQAFDWLETEILAHPAEAIPIVQAAIATTREFTHYAVHAGAFRRPTNVTQFIDAAAAYARFDNLTDAPAGWAAVSAAAACGIHEAKLSSTLTFALMKAAALRASQRGANMTGPPALQSDGFSPNAGTVTPTRGPAGVATGFVAMLLQPGDSSSNAELTECFKKIVEGAPSQALEITQAAAQAAVHVSGNPSFGVSVFANAALLVPGVASNFNLTQLLNAAAFGANLANANGMGAGAAGVVNYTHHSFAGNPVVAFSSL